MRSRALIPFVLAVFALPAMAGGQEPSKVVKFPPGARLIVLESNVKGEINWRLDRRLRDPGFTYEDKANKRQVIARPPAGTYEILAVEKGSGEFLEWVLVVEGPDPGPGPGPGPNPPDPPIPDTFSRRVQKAYQLDVAAGKGGEAERKTMAFAFAEFGQFLPAMNSTDNVKKLVDTTATLVLKGKLPVTMTAIATYLEAMVPEYTRSQQMTAVLRGQFEAAFKDVSEALNAVTPGPGPGPTPPPDPPDEPLVKDIKAALAKEPSDRTYLTELAKICLNIKAMVKDGTITDVKQIRDSYVAQIRDRVAPKLAYVRGVIVRRLDMTLPTMSTVLSGPMRDSIAAEFDLIAASLERSHP